MGKNHYPPTSRVWTSRRLACKHRLQRWITTTTNNDHSVEQILPSGRTMGKVTRIFVLHMEKPWVVTTFEARVPYSWDFARVIFIPSFACWSGLRRKILITMTNFKRPWKVIYEYQGTTYQDCEFYEEVICKSVKRYKTV